jgi:SAM-dependent methyltransferase
MLRQSIFDLAKKIAYPALDAKWRVERYFCSSCPVCSGPLPFDELRAYGRVFLRCTHCSHIWAHDYSKARAAFGMGLSGWGGSEPDTGGQSEIFLARYCAENFGSKSVLLFGTGPTRAFRVLHDEGMDVYGCDVSHDVIFFRQQEFGASRFFHIDRAAERHYDVVVATEVIEHFFDPIAELSRIARLCRPGGVFCGSTGFSSAGEVEDGGTAYMAPRGHVIYWSERSLGQAFDRLGWQLHSFGLASNVPRARLFFGSGNPAVNAKLDEAATKCGGQPIFRWS